MIAMALANDPEILIADEPTTALDVTVQARILRLIQDIQKKLEMTVILITHDLTIVETIADRVAVMHEGKLIETGEVKKIFKSPKQEYTKKLLGAAPKGRAVEAEEKAPEVLKADNLKVYFPIKKGFLGKIVDHVKAVDGVDFTIKEGHTLGVVGESGSGKSTLGYAAMRIVSSEGDIIFDGDPIHSFDSKTMRPLRKKMQMVFQDPFASLNPRMSIAQIISEGLLVHEKELSKAEVEKRVDKALSQVGLDTSIKNRYPHEFSGGQRQRIGISRAIILNPK